jgi:hypothetical protein
MTTPSPTKLRDWFRFSTRQGVLLVACVALCIAANRDNDPDDLIGLVAGSAAGVALLLMVPTALTVVGGLLHKGDDREPPEV